jgi:hypothetical protein
MIERVTDLQGRVQSARAALEGLAERAARLRARLEIIPPSDPPLAPEPAVPPSPGLGPEATPETNALASSLERLTQDAQSSWVSVTAGAHEGDDGRLVSDAWEIALISEEGK